MKRWRAVGGGDGAVVESVVRLSDQTNKEQQDTKTRGQSVG